jgi:drug/metabolite transporter (DMT)-like permease
VSTGSILVRNAQEYAPSIVIAAYRLVLATLFLAPVALLRYRGELGAMRRPHLLLAALSGFFLSLQFATWISSLQYTTVASSVVLVSTSPLWVALLSPLVLKEPLTRPILLGMGLALVGTLIVGLSDTCLD